MSQHILGYSTQPIVVIDIPVVGIEIEIVVEVVEPTSPANK